MTPHAFSGPRLPAWARIADALTVAFLLAALYVAVFGGVRIGSVFSMSTPWRALLGLTVICGLRHYLIPTSPLHMRVWDWRPVRPVRVWDWRPVRLAVRVGRWSVSAYEHATHMTAARVLQILGLTALAVAQPLFDVVSREPTFFVARNTTSVQLGAFVILIGVVLPLVLVGIEAVCARLHPVAGNVVHILLLTVLVSVLLLPLLKRADGMGTASLLAVALLLAGGAAVACQRSSVGNMFLTVLSPAALVVPAAFLMNSEIQGALIGTDHSVTAARVQHAPPIVFIVFDEFPTSSLMNGEREIDGSRYPHFARLADDATWFRNASTVSSQTQYAVPAMVTGRYPVEPYAVPTRRYYPNNLFTMLSESYRMTVFGRFLQLCPANVCTYDLEVHDTLWDLTADLAVVYLHVVAPDSLATRLPPIVGDWRGFATRRLFREVDGERRRNDRSSEYDRFLQTITPENSGRLYFLHTLTPHMPFEYVPSGTRYEAPDYQRHTEEGERLFLKSDPWLSPVLQQRHLLQVGFADHFIGDLIDRLQVQGIYDEALIIITADHGSSYQPGKPRRSVGDGNRTDILLVPLVIKLPQQVTGEISDRSAEVIDILPTIADVLSATVPYEVDGRSLLNTSEPANPTKTFIRRNAERVTVESYVWWQLEDHSLEQKLQHFQSSLYGLGPHAALVGRPVSTLDVPVGTASPVRLENALAFDDVDVEAETLPLYVRGTFNTRPAERASLAIGVNGVIVATTVSYLEQGEWVFASMIAEEALVSGANEVQVFVVDGMSDDPAQGSAVSGRGP